MLCEKGMIITKSRSVLLVPHNIKQTTPTKTQINTEDLTNIAQTMG